MDPTFTQYFAHYATKAVFWLVYVAGAVMLLNAWRKQP